MNKTAKLTEVSLELLLLEEGFVLRIDQFKYLLNDALKDIVDYFIKLRSKKRQYIY